VYWFRFPPLSIDLLERCSLDMRCVRACATPLVCSLMHRLAQIVLAWSVKRAATHHTLSRWSAKASYARMRCTCASCEAYMLLLPQHLSDATCVTKVLYPLCRLDAQCTSSRKRMQHVPKLCPSDGCASMTGCMMSAPNFK
jgi:hypothetical protein